MPTTAINDTVDPAARRRAVIASTLGNAFEWFDFTIYGLFAVVIAKQFFPASSETNSLLLSVATLGISFFVRPIGGVLFGLYADRVGRKSALSLMVLLMALGTGMIGLTPSYASVGIAAPLLIVLARIIQGFSVGGEFGSATALLIEYAPPGKRGFYGSFQMCAQALSVFLGGLASYVLNTSLSRADLESWGWRIPFLLGILIGPIGFYIRRRIEESPEFAAYRRTATQGGIWPLKEVFARHGRELFAGFGLTVAGTVSFYVTLIYIPIHAVKQLHLAQSMASLSTLLSALLLLFLCPLSGYLSDQFGRKPLIVTGIALYGVTSYALFLQLQHQPSDAHLLMAQLLPSLCMGMVWGGYPATVTETIPVGMRSTGVSILYNFAVMLFGGLAALTITWLIKVTGNPLVPAYYILFGVTFSLLSYGIWGRNPPPARLAVAV